MNAFSCFLFFRALLCSITFVKRQQSKSNLSVLSFFLLMSHPNSFVIVHRRKKLYLFCSWSFQNLFFFIFDLFFSCQIFSSNLNCSSGKKNLFCQKPCFFCLFCSVFYFVQNFLWSTVKTKCAHFNRGLKKHDFFSFFFDC